MGSPRRHRTVSSSCPPQLSLLPLDAIREQPSSAVDTDNNTAASAAIFALRDVHPNQAAGSNSHHEPEPSDPGLLNGWTVEEVLRIQEANNEAIIQGVRATINEDRLRTMNAFTDWVERQFTPNQVQDKIARLEKDLELTLQRNLELESGNTNMRAKLRNNGTKLREANTKLKKALLERDEQRRLADGGGIANSSKVTDNAILDKWKTLNYNIRVLAHSLAKKAPTQSLDDTGVARLDWVSAIYRKHLQDDDYREFVIQGYLWSLVNDMVFDASACLWGGPGVAELKSIRDRIIVRIRGDDFKMCSQATRWVAQGSGIHDQLWGCDSEGVKELAAVETRRMEPFFCLPDHSSGKTGLQVYNDLKVIVQSAVELDQIFMCSKAIFQIHWRDSSQDSFKSQRYNPEVMESLCNEQELSAKSIVKMVIAPFLYKVGNADGQNYDRRMLLAKATVVCN